MKNHLPLISLLLLISFYFSCERNSASEKTNNKKEIQPLTDSRKTQALILTQDFPFDESNRNKITGDYISHKKLTIPQNLSPQNKWIMFEGPVLENDLVAYRYYADSRHRFDIYGKKVSSLVMDTVSWKYHDIMDWGADILKVGNSLGLGSPAIWYEDSLHTLSVYDEKTIAVMSFDNEEGSSKSGVRTTFKGLKIKNIKIDLIQDWTIEAGKPWSEIHLKVKNGNLPEDALFATGIVKHLPEITQGENENNFYALNWGKQSFHKENLGMAIIAAKKYQPESIEDELSHVFVFRATNKEVKYRFLSVWEKDNNNVKKESEFNYLVNNIQ